MRLIDEFRRAQGRTIACALVLSLSVIAMPGRAAQEIVVTELPPTNEETSAGGTVSGRYLGDPTGKVLCAAVYIDGLGFYAKPFVGGLDIDISPDGSFTFDSTTDGCDNRWEMLSLAVIADAGGAGVEDCPAVSVSADPMIPADAVASRLVMRPPAGVERDGERLWVRDSGVCNTVGPGANDFDRDNVRTSYEGLLLSTSDDGSMLTSAEVVNRAVTGYGRYVYELTLPVGGLDPSTVLGLFTYDRLAVFDRTVPDPNFAEVDFEIGESLISGGNAQCIVQGGERKIFTLTPTQNELTVVLNWHPGKFSCSIYDGHVAEALSTAIPFETFVTNVNVPEPGSDTRARMNLWVHEPGTALPTKVILRSIHWYPLPDCRLALRESANGSRDLFLAIGSTEPGLHYTLNLLVFNNSYPLYDAVLPELVPSIELVVPFPILPDAAEVVSLEAKLVSLTGGVVCRETLRYNVAADRVL